MRSPAPRGRKKKLPKFRLRRVVRSKFWRYEESCGRSFLFDGSLMRRWLQRAARRPAATASCLQLDALPPRHPLIHRSGFARDRPGLGRATPPAPCCFQIIRSGLQQVRFLRKLMPGEGFYMNVLWCIIKAWKRCAVPAAFYPAAMNPSVPSSPHAQPSHGIELFSLYVYPAGVCFFATQSSGAQGRSKSRKFKSGL